MTRTIWSEDEFLHHCGIQMLHSFSEEDWNEITDVWKGKTDIWVCAFVDVVSQIETGDELGVLIDIAMCSTKEPTISAMEYVHSVKEKIDSTLYSELKKREQEFIKSTINQMQSSKT